MKYLLDNIIFSLQKAGGISIVWQNLIKNLLPLTQDIEFIEYDTNFNIFRKDLEIPSSKIDAIKSFHPLFSQLRTPLIKNSDPFIFHSSYFRTCKNPKAINVTTVHDFIYEQGIPTLKQKIRIKLNYRAIRNSDAIVCVSENTKHDLLRFVPDVDIKKIHIIYNGVSEDYYTLPNIPYPEYKDYLLFIGGRQGYKNFNFVTHSIKHTSWKLLICGQNLSKQEKLLLESTLPNRYKILTFPSNKELNKIYNSVYALVYPSSYEGFGIPILEAQRASCPVIALNTSSIPEVIGSTPLLMQELTPEEFIIRLNYLNNQSVKKQVIAAGLENSKRFSWRKMAQEYFRLYNYLLSKSLH
ncbi:MAG: glycosyltransferase family 4 protein [Bacteroides sp.]|nr:glycosyltransferase family 4 protein [Bacteroides sp.]